MIPSFLLIAAPWGKYCHESYFIKGLGSLCRVLCGQEETIVTHCCCLTWGQSLKTPQCTPRGENAPSGIPIVHFHMSLVLINVTLGCPPRP